jgi:hypothetical protein
VLCCQVPCPYSGNIVVRVNNYRSSAGGWLRLALRNVAGMADISSVHLARVSACLIVTLLASSTWFVLFKTAAACVYAYHHILQWVVHRNACVAYHVGCQNPPTPATGATPPAARTTQRCCTASAATSAAYCSCCCIDALLDQHAYCNVCMSLVCRLVPPTGSP